MSGARRRTAVVVGTKFGRVYLAALSSPDSPFELVGVVGQGSGRSRACATQHGVPLYTDVGDVPGDVDLACVIVSAAVNGGPGTDLAVRLLERGINVVQEHPMHHDEVARCLRAARRGGAIHYLNTHYPHVLPVARLIEAAKGLLARERPLFVDGACAIQFKFSFFDVVARAIGRVRPWVFPHVPPLPADVRAAAATPPPFRSIDGVIGGVPVSLRIQNQMHATDPDNHAHVCHRITIGTEAGSLTLADTHGPILWSPRAHIPIEVQRGVDPAASTAPALDLATAAPVGDPNTPTWRQVMTREWPAAVARALAHVHDAIDRGDSLVADAQHHLALTRLVQDVNAKLGPPELLRDAPPQPRGVVDLFPLGVAS